MKKLAAIATLILVWAVVLALGIFLWLRWPQRIVLPDGSKVTLAAVTLGKHHQFPDKKISGAKFDTPADVLCVWFRESFTNGSPPDYQILEFDQSGSFCAGRFTAIRRFPDGNGTDVACVRLDSFPRRDGKLRLQFETPDANGNWAAREKELTVSYPVRKPSAPWPPQPLPATANDGDLSVTLTKLVYGVSMGQGQPQAASDPADKAVLASFRITQNGAVTANWRPVQIETWDATGNYSDGRGRIRRAGDETTMTYQWGLSPAEAAWKLRAGFVRTADFPEDELFAVADIPVSTNAPSARNRRRDVTGSFASKKVGDSTVTVFPAVRAGNPGEWQLHVMVDPPPPLPEPLHFTLVEATDDQGRKLKTPHRSWGGVNFDFYVAAGGAKTVSATFALQTGRSVEFTVKPEQP